MDNYIVYLGAVGWRQEAWRGGFYPEDLPEDWQLSFYNTQFRCVYLPAEYWRNASDEEVANWLQDTREGFRFVLGTADRGCRGSPPARLDASANAGCLRMAPTSSGSKGNPICAISRNACKRLRKAGRLCT